MAIFNIDKWLMDNSKYSQKERELIIETIEEYAKTTSNINNAQHLFKQKVIHILKKTVEKCNIDLCELTWYELTDMIAYVIKGARV